MLERNIGRMKKRNEIIHSMTIDQDNVFLQCAKKILNGTSCRRIIVGKQRGYYFESPIFGSCDLRNKYRSCYQHKNTIEFGRK